MSEVKPALTPEEWAHALSWSHGLKDYIVERADQFGYGRDGPADLHSMAALCLNGQPFGFTHEDVRLLRYYVTGDIGDDAENLADRIAALLPPEAP